MTEKYYPRLDETVIWDCLPNGLTVAVVPRKGFRKKMAYFVTNFGSMHTAFSLDGQSFHAPQGVAHYLEHKLFDMPEGEVSSAFAGLGASVNAFTGYDMTAYYFSCTQHFEKNLALLLEFVSAPYFPAESVEREKGIIGQEIGMSKDNPDHRVFEQLMEAMYRRHPIRRPILGTEDSLEEITPQTLLDCHRAFYCPENMILCVVGDVQASAVSEIARRVLGDTPQACARKLPYPEETAGPDAARVECTMEVAMPMFQLGFPCPAVGKGNQAVRQEVIGDLACEVLFGEASPLYLRLYDEGVIDSSFGGGFEVVDGIAMVTAGGDSDTPEAVRDAILAQAKVLSGQGVAEDQLLRLKRSLLGRRIRDLDSFDSTCFRICAYHFSEFDYMDFPVVVESITAAEILEFISRAITPDNCCLSVVYPLDKEAEA